MNKEQVVITPRKVRRKKKEKRKSTKVIKGITIGLFIVFMMLIFGSIGAIIGIRIGLAPDVQEYLVTSSMTTLNHKYIAKIVATPEQIKEIMKTNRVDENYDRQNTSLIVQNKPKETHNKITLLDISRDGYKGYMLLVPNPEKVIIGTSSRLGTHGTKITGIVKDYSAIAGINSGGFTDKSGHGTGGSATGILISNGVIKYYDNKVSKFNIIGFNKSNVLVLGKYTLEKIKTLNLRDAVDFHPFLIVNGVPTKIYGNGGWGSAPRTAIGQRSDGTVLLVTIDGRQLSSRGATMKELQDIMSEHGAVNAANLDGGASTVMYYRDKIINSPSSKYGDRFLPSAFLVLK